jgi:transposase
MAAFYGTAIIPARPSKPRDKSKVEKGVQVVERWILAKLRNRTFFSLDELNTAIDKELAELNQRPFQKLEGSRQSLFDELEKPALKPLPEERFQFALWKTLTVNIDYHVEVEKNYYSVPYQLIKEKVDVRITSGLIEIIHKGKRVASHLRSFGLGKSCTLPEHRPAAHQKYLEWTPSRIIRWAGDAGPSTGQLAKHILEKRPFPEQGYRSCLGLIRLADRYGKERLEAACKRALFFGTHTYNSVKSILEKGLDRTPLEKAPASKPIMHQNIRGKEYFGQECERIC